MALAINVQNVTVQFALTPLRHNTLKTWFAKGLLGHNKPQVQIFESLKNVSCQLHKGQSLALLGNNGSGKSTLLKLMAGVLDPTTGTVQTFGRVAPLIEVGVGFHPDLTGEENIYLNASMFGFSNRQTHAIFDNIVDFSELKEFLQMPVKNYSSGMYMRLGFAVAVHMQPDILLADEILAVGDQNFQNKCLARIKDMQASGLTLVFVTHSPDHAKSFCQNYMRLDHGVVVESGQFE
jgi:ABC-2 type transport system ATP-binding protein/lipopolysaccharide transport system ATP-binding protein